MHLIAELCIEPVCKHAMLAGYQVCLPCEACHMTDPDGLLWSGHSGVSVLMHCCPLSIHHRWHH